MLHNDQSLAKARFLALRQHQRDLWNRDNVARYHTVIADLEQAYGIDLTSFRVPDGEMRPRLIGITRAPLSGRFPARKQYSKESFCDEGLMQERIEGIYLYLQSIESQIVIDRSAPDAWSKAGDGRAEPEEGTLELFHGQEFPKSMHHATKPPVIVYSRREQAELGPDWSETYIHQPYPTVRYGWNNKTITVNNAEEEAALGVGWVKNPDAYRPYLGPRPRKALDQDETKWADDWARHGLSADHLKKIKAKLMRVDAEFWRSPAAHGADLDAMRRAFNGIAEVLSAAGLLTEGLVQQQIQELVWDSAIAGGWYRYAGETQDNIFPERQGHYWVWRDDGFDWKGLFHSETKEWLAWLLENAVQLNSHPVKGSEVKHAVNADSGKAEAVVERASRPQGAVSPKTHIARGQRYRKSPKDC
jgi:hypothetical protein